MKITILAVGKIKDEWLKTGICEYCKRISKFSDLTIEEIPDVSDEHGIEKCKEEEGNRLLAKIKDDDYVIALDVHGDIVDSIVLSNKVERWLEYGGARITFIIAGSNGYSKKAISRANEKICLSTLTFPHQLTRLILLEQLFRSFKISRNEKYHK